MNKISVSTTALLAAPFLITACDPINVNGTIANSANSTLSGCETDAESCNPTTAAGIVANIRVNPETEELSIRFIQTSKMSPAGTMPLAPTSFTYSDGRRIIDFTGDGELFEGDGGEGVILESTTEYVSQLLGIWELEEDGGEGAVGFVGYHTDPDFVPTAGGASYSGLAEFVTSLEDELGTSVLVVDFSGGTADLTATPDTGILGFEYMEATDMAIDGYTFTTGDVTLYDDLDNPVNITGANTQSVAAGMFFGPIDAIADAPEEFGAVAIVTGNDDWLIMETIGSVDVD